jgi:ribonuclease VapC
MPAYVLDSYALLAYFNSETGGQQIVTLLKAAHENTADLFASLINVGEIYYLAYRRLGIDQAQEMLRTLRGLPVKLCEASESRILTAAALKALHPISYADAFAAALAIELDAQLVTGDTEFKVLQPGLNLLWI